MSINQHESVVVWEAENQFVFLESINPYQGPTLTQAQEKNHD